MQLDLATNHVDSIDCGKDCNDILKHSFDGTEEDQEIVTRVKSNCLHFYITASTEIRDNLHFDHDLLYKITILDPAKIFERKENLAMSGDIICISRALSVNINEVELQKEWDDLPTYFSREDQHKIRGCNFDEGWKKILLTENQNGEIVFGNLLTLINAVRSLPNSNADAERTFSVFPDTVTKKRVKLSTETTDALVTTKIKYTARNELPALIDIDENLLSRMESKIVYEPRKKKIRVESSLHAAEPEECMNLDIEN